jgi:putative FmdB family regulatory protein
MPTYEYECTKCGRRFEKFQNMSDKPIRKCSQCGGTVRRLIGAGAAVISKGSSRDAPGEALVPRCGRDTPCCGRDVPCGKYENGA